MARVFYRLGQFWQGLWAEVTPADQQRAAEVLPATSLSLFLQMPIDAQRHSLNVLEKLWSEGPCHPDLAVAALLHDCGKVVTQQGGRSLGLWVRGPLLLLEKFFPDFVDRWALSTLPEKPSERWRYLLYVQREHAAIGAAWATQAGCSPLSCWLIANHQTPLVKVKAPAYGNDDALHLLALLQMADDGN